MLLEIKDLLSPAEVARLIELAGKLKFVDGRVSNPHAVAKNNLQADFGDPLFAESVKIAADAYARSAQFQDFALPRFVAPPMLAKYQPGMNYGAHADAALMTVMGRRMRSDLSSTIFLNDPRSYEGGELVVHLGVRALPIKLSPGSAIVYPSTTLHEVAPVRSGERLVAITFIQSSVAEEAKRDILFELGEVAAIEGAKMDWLSRTRLEVARQNLTRMWSEP
ncbi:MAG: Fe2+-dependent dioxygenase [Hyphomonadaceae bacterium]